MKSIFAAVTLVVIPTVANAQQEKRVDINPQQLAPSLEHSSDPNSNSSLSTSVSSFDQDSTSDSNSDPDVVNTEYENDEGSESDFTGRFNFNYSAVFFGPSLKNPSRFQPGPDGKPDPNLPVILKNFVGLGYNLTNEIQLSGSAYWIWQPIGRQQVMMQDPFFKISHNSLVNLQNFNLYADFRVIPGVSTGSRESNMKFGVHSVQVASYALGPSRFSLGTYSSALFSAIGQGGYGNDLEFYLGPNVAYQLTPQLALNLIYEIRASHPYGQRGPFTFVNEGTDIQPGVYWDVTPQLSLNPYLTIQTGGKVGLDTTSLGFLMSWTLI